MWWQFFLIGWQRQETKIEIRYLFRIWIDGWVRNMDVTWHPKVNRGLEGTLGFMFPLMTLEHFSMSYIYYIWSFHFSKPLKISMCKLLAQEFSPAAANRAQINLCLINKKKHLNDCDKKVYFFSWFHLIQCLRL